MLTPKIVSHTYRKPQDNFATLQFTFHQDTSISTLRHLSRMKKLALTIYKTGGEGGKGGTDTEPMEIQLEVNHDSSRSLHSSQHVTAIAHHITN